METDHRKQWNRIWIRWLRLHITLPFNLKRNYSSIELDFFLLHIFWLFYCFATCSFGCCYSWLLLLSFIVVKTKLIDRWMGSLLVHEGQTVRMLGCLACPHTHTDCQLNKFEIFKSNTQTDWSNVIVLSWIISLKLLNSMIEETIRTAEKWASER